MTGRPGADVAVVGVGAWGSRHLAALVAMLGEERVAFYDAAADRSAEAAARYPTARGFASWEEFLASDVRAAVIAAPAAQHAELARAALRAGKDLLVEKPLALAPAAAAAVVREAEKRGAVLMVGHILLFDPAFEALHGAAAAGELGAIKYVEAERAKLGTIRTAEDVLFSLAAHDVAAALWLVGRPPLAVSSVGARVLGGALADAASLNMTFEGGATAHLWASWLYPVPARRFVVVGDAGMAVVEQRGRSELTLYRRGGRMGADGPAVFDEGSRAVPASDADSLRAELGHFLECVATRATPRADGRQGLAVVKVLAAAQKSARAGGAPVRLEGDL